MSDKKDLREIEVKEDKEFSGTVKRPFTIAGKKANKEGKGGTPDKKYTTGMTYKTKNEKFFQSLINKKRIEQ
jgi:hypothetical protein